MKVRRILGLLLLILFSSCKEKSPVPKPLSYLRTELPDHEYFTMKVDNPVVGFTAEMSTLFSLSKNLADLKYGFQEVDLGAANGTILMYSKRFNTKDSLFKLINASNDMVDEHKVKADQIDYVQIKDYKRRVFGTFFTLKGNVATNFQFYLTDSSSRFIRGELLLNCTPNYDSLRPVIDYLKVDMDRMLSSFRWNK
ncbi:MAG: hypothetical protein ACKO5L_03770 [Bacteroidota bacterium]